MQYILSKPGLYMLIQFRMDPMKFILYTESDFFRLNAHRLRKMLGSRVIAKSTLVKAAQPVFNVEFDVS